MPKNILLLESNELARDFYHQKLSKAGHDVTSSHLSVLAIAYWMKALKSGKPFDLIITDLMNSAEFGAPISDEPEGILFVRELRSLELFLVKKREFVSLQRVRIIAHSSAADMYRRRCLEAGFDEVVEKEQFLLKKGFPTISEFYL
jgi:CheY-like chemotaxis protein